jgi:hypothetical protein
VKKTRGDEPIGVVIHICMETTEGNSLCTYLYLKLAKTSFFLFIFFLLQNLRRSDGSAEGGTCGSREVVGKIGRRINTVQKMCAHVCKCKNDT